MSENKLLKRDEIDNSKKWAINDIYASNDEALKDFEKAISLSKEILSYQGRLTESSQTLYKVNKLLDDAECTFEKAFVYTTMLKDQDSKLSSSIELFSKGMSAYSQVAANTAFMTPELLSSNIELIEKYIEENEELKLYSFRLHNILREKEHVLSKEEEMLMASLMEVFNGPKEIYGSLVDSDFNFGFVKNENGESVQLTHGNYISLLTSHNRNVRKEAFETLYKKYEEYINTISTTYAQSVKKDVLSAKTRKYNSSRQAALFQGNIPEDVYDNLINTVHEYLPVMYKYMSIRKKLLGLDDLKMYDCYVPLVKLPKKEYSFDEAFELAKKGLKVLGEDYLADFEKGREEHWIDVYENEGKRSGAYSISGYKTKPYILLNFSSTLNDVFTIAHEMGHSINSYYSNKEQPYCYHDYSIFTAEVCSTVNEALLVNYLIDNENDKDIKMYLLNHYLEEFRTTLFRQTMFAEFEYWSHKEIENGGALTSENLCAKYDELNKLYFGPEMDNTEYIKYEWARIPHFYRPFYVYQYATGYSAATAISKKILTEGIEARDNYIKFLGAGYSDYPVETLKIAGVDMSKPEPIKLAMETFKELVDEFEKMI